MEPDTQRAFDDFTLTTREKGVRDALGAIVMRSDYRFIGIWRFQDGKANAAIHFDRENPAQLLADEVPDTATYCTFIRQTRKPFQTADSMQDAALAAHPARAAVRTYCGVPLMDSAGNVMATLCHYDVVPRDPAQIDMELMLNVASYLVEGQLVPPYPAQLAA